MKVDSTVVATGAGVLQDIVLFISFPAMPTFSKTSSGRD